MDARGSIGLNAVWSGAQRIVVSSLFLCVVGTASSLAQPIQGRASVIDGDTIDIAGKRIRFNGIDAPESWQLCQDEAGKDYRCGKVAADALDAFLAASRPASCEPRGRDRYGRTIADCRRADGASVQRWLVRSGWALDWPRYSKGAYAREQDEARRAGAGVWRGPFTVPWEARKTR